MFVFPNIARVVKPDSVTKIGLSYYVLSTVRDFLLPEIVESIIQRDHIAVDTTDDIIQQHPDLVGGFTKLHSGRRHIIGDGVNPIGP